MLQAPWAAGPPASTPPQRQTRLRHPTGDGHSASPPPSPAADAGPNPKGQGFPRVIRKQTAPGAHRKGHVPRTGPSKPAPAAPALRPSAPSGGALVSLACISGLHLWPISLARISGLHLRPISLAPIWPVSLARAQSPPPPRRRPQIPTPNPHPKPHAAEPAPTPTVMGARGCNTLAPTPTLPLPTLPLPTLPLPEPLPNLPTSRTSNPLPFPRPLA